MTRLGSGLRGADRAAADATGRGTRDEPMTYEPLEREAAVRTRYGVMISDLSYYLR